MSPMGPMGLMGQMGQMSPMSLMGQGSPIGPMGLMSPMSPMGLMGQGSPIGQLYAHRGFLSNRRDHSSQASGHVLDSRGLDAILPLRTSMLNRTYDDFWVHRSRLVA